jgi:hypothetical protein
MKVRFKQDNIKMSILAIVAGVGTDNKVYVVKYTVGIL